MIEVLVLLLFLGSVLGATLLFKSLVARRIANDLFRVLAVGLFFVAALTVGAWGVLTLALSAIFYTPTTTHPIDDTYYFTQQEYGFVTMMSNGYNLTFYRQRPYWLDQKLGTVQLECSGKELVRATIVPAGNKRVRLRIAADAQERLDTVLDIEPTFNFRRTFEDRTIDFTKRP